MDNEDRRPMRLTAPVVMSALNYCFAVGVVVSVAMGWLREDGIIVGFGIGVYTASNNFWFGSSESSKRNADALRGMINPSAEGRP